MPISFYAVSPVPFIKIHSPPTSLVNVNSAWPINSNHVGPLKISPVSQHIYHTSARESVQNGTLKDHAVFYHNLGPFYHRRNIPSNYFEAQHTRISSLAFKILRSRHYLLKSPPGIQPSCAAISFHVSPGSLAPEP